MRQSATGWSRRLNSDKDFRKQLTIGILSCVGQTNVDLKLKISLHIHGTPYLIGIWFLSCRARALSSDQNAHSMLTSLQST